MEHLYLYCNYLTVHINGFTGNGEHSTAAEREH